MIHFDGRPVYTLQAVGRDRIRLLLHGTAGSGAFLEEIAAESPILEMGPETAGPDMGILFTLPSPVREASAAWLAGTDALYLEFIHSGTVPAVPEGGMNASTLKPVHFGFVDMRTRMVLALDRHPAWELTHISQGRVRLHLPLVSPAFDRSRYGPANNLAMATLRANGSDTDIDIQLLTRIDRVRVFGTEDGGRLVVDLFEGERFEEPVLEAEASGAGSAAATGPSRALPERSGTTESVRERPAAPPAEIPTATGGPLFRGRIASGGGTGDAGVESPPPVSTPTEREGITEEDIVQELAPDEALLYGEIRQASESGSHDRTADLCSRFLDLFPGSPMVERVLFLKGDAEFSLVRLGDTDRFSAMMKTYQNAVSAFRQSPRVPRAYLNMGRASSLLGNDYASIGYLNIVLHSADDAETLARAQLERGRIYLKVNRPDKAVEDFKMVLENHPDSPLVREARMDIARYFEAVGLHAKAWETLNGLSEAHPRFYLDHPEFLFLRGKNALYLERYDLAREFFFRALNIGGQPESADLILARIGDTYHHASLPREAESFYRAVIREYPDGDGASIARLRLAGYESGYQAFHELRQDHADKPVGDLAALEMARKYYEEKQYTRALEVLRELMGKPFQNEMKMEAQRLFYRTAEQEAKRLHREGRPDALVEFYLARKDRLRRNIDPEVLLLVGLSMVDLGKHLEAAHLLESIKLYDLNQVSKGRRAVALTRSLLAAGEEDRALALLEKKADRALLPAADRQELDLILAGLYGNRGRPGEAYELYQGLVRGERLLADRDIASVHLEMGRIEGERGELEQARASLNRCIGLSGRLQEARPILRQAYAELGTAYAKDGRHVNALEAFEKALEEGYTPGEEGYWELRFQMALACLATGDYGRAEPLLVEISEQGDGPLQQRVRLRLGALDLEKQLRRLSSWSDGN
ncbi:MAG: tetratricopeptide repeat protein [Deltaproteobacteria bacterium]|nr:tetratricopeptide repeat protein [Deltaproteobacteria bacterium]